jgi:hypothetical protein
VERRGCFSLLGSPKPGALSCAYFPATLGGFGFRYVALGLDGGFGAAFRLPGVSCGGGGVCRSARRLPSRSSGSLQANYQRKSIEKAIKFLKDRGAWIPYPSCGSSPKWGIGPVVTRKKAVKKR